MVRKLRGIARTALASARHRRGATGLDTHRALLRCPLTATPHRMGETLRRTTKPGTAGDVGTFPAVTSRKAAVRTLCWMLRCVRDQRPKTPATSGYPTEHTGLVPGRTARWCAILPSRDRATESSLRHRWHH